MSERRLNVLNNSRSKAFWRCARLHYFGYELGIERVEKSVALVTGSRWHKSLEAWWLALKDGKGDGPLEAALAALEPNPDPYEQARAEAILMGYHYRWINEDIECLGVEVEFEAPLLDPITGDAHPDFIIAGTIDAICRIGERVFVVEHKTSSADFSAGAYYWQKLTLDSQVSLYLCAGPSLGFEFAGCLYDVIGKAPALAPRLATPETERKYTKEGKLYARQRLEDEPVQEFQDRLLAKITEEPEKLYGRAEIVRLGDELEQSILDVWETADLISEARAKSRWPRNVDSCFDFNRSCDFFGVCARGEDLKNSEVFQSARKDENQ